MERERQRQMQNRMYRCYSYPWKQQKNKLGALFLWLYNPLKCCCCLTFAGGIAKESRNGICAAREGKLDLRGPVKNCGWTVTRNWFGCFLFCYLADITRWQTVLLKTWVLACMIIKSVLKFVFYCFLKTVSASPQSLNGLSYYFLCAWM